MALSDAAHLEALRTARDAIVAGIAEGRLTISYTIRGREVTNADPVKSLENIEQSITIYERKVNRQTRSRYRAVALSRPLGRG